MQQFLKTNLDGFTNLTRLNDRFQRKKLQKHRKKVFLIETGSVEKWIVLRFSKRYKTIFDNYLNARDFLLDQVRGQDWLVDEPNLFIMMPYLGSNFISLDSGALGKIAHLLLGINTPSKISRFSTPRYLKNLIELNSSYNIFELANLAKVVKKIEDGELSYAHGPGVQDPALNNFTHLNNEIFLVDLDNFSTEVNYDYELGFLLSDIDLEVKKELASDMNLRMRTISEDIHGELDSFPFWIGYISRIATNLIDVFDSETKPDILESSINLTIEEICGYLLKTD